jgi:MFS family permease
LNGFVLPVRRNTVLLAATLAVNSAVLQLVAAVSSLTFVLVTGVRGLLGLGPAIFLTASAVTAVPAGRMMDRFGRIPVLTFGFSVGAAGCAVTGLATHTDSTPLVIVGFVLIGAAQAISLLIRTAAGDMYPPARRARGISYVLFGSVFGAILGPTVFSPMFAGKDVEADALTVPWLVAGGIALIALVLVQFVRPDPKRIAELIGSHADEPPPTAAPLREIVRRPGVIPAMVAGLASFGVMVSVMNLSGYVVVEHYHHHQDDIFPIIGAHVFGMYALVLVVGALIDRVGRTPALELGLVVMALSTIGLLWVTSVFATAVLLLGLGVGWNISFVAATAQMADRTSPAERGKLLGFNDQLAAFLAAGLALLGGYALDAIGVAALAIGATVIVASPILLIARPAARATAATTLLVVAVLASAGAARAVPYRHYQSRPDLKPPRIKLFELSRLVSPGYIFIAPKKSVEQGGPLILDNRGRMIWFRPVDERGVTDFRVQHYEGKPVLTWWRGKSADDKRHGRYSIYDQSYRLIKHIRPRHGLAGDMHEFSITKRGTALMTLSHVVRVKSRKVLEGALQEIDIKTGQVLFEWHSIGHVQLTESYYRLPRNPDQTYDYFHINTIEVDRDGNLLVSARNTHAIYKLNRRTGEVMWRLGGKRSDFELGRGVRFGWQHDVRRQPDGTITIFDNAAAPKLRRQSRGIVLRLDERAKRATLLHSYVHTPPIVAVDQGNMQKLPNGHYLIGWGHQPFVTEFGPQGKALLDLRFARKGADSYRAYRFPWVGRPRSKPAIAVDGDTLYVSWNGATEVRSWQLLVGAEKKKLHPLLTVEKEGFETGIALPANAAWVAVRALDRLGRSMARSTAVGRA